MRIPYVLVIFTMLLSISAPKVSASSSPPGPFQQVATTVIPAGYGELLNAHADSLTDATPAAIKEISDKLSFYAQTIGRVSNALDIGGKLYMGDTKEAAIAAGLTVLGEAAGSASGKAFLGAYGLTTLPVTALITSFQIYRMSEAELKKSTVGVKLEQLYDKIERDPQLKNRNRELGVGDPIPATPQTVDYVWRKVLLDSTWRDLFKTYVVEELGRDWPDPGIWARWTLPGNVLEEGELYQNKAAYQSYIAGLLSYLNRAAKLREQQVVMQRYGEELRQKTAGVNAGSIINKYATAVGELPKVREFAEVSPRRIREALQGDTINPLIQIINNSKRYAVDVLTWIPSSGKLGEERAALLKKLEHIHDEAWSVRKFLEDRRRKEALRRAAAAKVAAWSASPFGFETTFSELKSTIDAEFESTGSVAGVLNRLAEERRQMEKHYTDQGNQVDAEYEIAQQMRPVPPERNEEARKQFWTQLDAYRTVDRFRYSEVTAEVNDYLETLGFLAKMDEEQLRELYSEIERRVRPFMERRILKHGEQEALTAYEHTLNSFCGPFTSSGYLGVGQYRFPSYTPSPGDSIGAFRGRHNQYIEGLRNKVDASRNIDFCGRTVELGSLIASIDQLIAMIDKLVEKKKDLEKLEEKVAEMEEVLTDPAPGISQHMLKYWSDRFEQEHKPFVKKQRELLERGEALKGPARSAQQLYQTDLGNIYNDLDYLSRLRRTLDQLDPVLNEFVAEYPRVRVDGSNERFVMRPEIIRVWDGKDCSALIGKRVFMNSSEVSQARQQLNRKLTENQLLWFDNHYNIGLRAFVDLYVSERSGLSNPPPDHYTFIDWEGRCQIFMKETFDRFSASLAEIDRFDLFFPQQMQKAIGGSMGWFVKMIGIPLLDYPVNNASIDIDNYPEDGLDFLKSVAENCWDDVMRASVMGVISTFEEKMAARHVWLAGEAHFLDVQERLSAAGGNMRTLLHEAQTAYNRNIDDPEVSRKYQQAAAREPAMMAVLNAAVNDPKLSPQRQDYFKKLREEYIEEFWWIRQWAGVESKPAVPPGPEPQKPAFDEQPIINFYDQFKQAYERKNDSRLMSFLDDKWSAGDGTTLYDVEDYFRNMFRVFDEIRLDVRGLRVEQINDGRYLASYDLTIIGRIYAHNLEHAEKSSVVEEIGPDRSGRMKIMRTPQGRFWHQ